MNFVELIPVFAAMLFALPPPAPGASRIDLGQNLFQKTCSACHGTEAKGGRGPDLTSGHWKWGSTDIALLQNILSGIPGTQMPGFPMPEEDARAVVAWLRSLRNTGPQEQVTGDPRTGYTLFFGSAGCSRCHTFGGRGGRLGPDLSRIAE